MEIWPVSVFVSSKLPSIMIAFKVIYMKFCYIWVILWLSASLWGVWVGHTLFQTHKHAQAHLHKAIEIQKMNPYNHVMMSDRWYVVLLKFSLHSRYVVILTGCTSTSIFHSCVMLFSLVYCTFILPFQSHIFCYVLSFSWCTMKYFHHLLYFDMILLFVSSFWHLFWMPCSLHLHACLFWSYCSTTMQFYTFLETTLVTLSLLPHFIAFFSDGEIPGTPGTLATTFLAFGK